MENSKIWYQFSRYKLLQSVGVSIFSTFIIKVIEKYGNINLMKSLFQTFFIELWPIWCSIGIGLIYLAAREIISIHKFITEGLKFNEKINELDQEKRDFMTNFNSVQNNLLHRMDEIEKMNKKIIMIVSDTDNQRITGDSPISGE